MIWEIGINTMSFLLTYNIVLRGKNKWYDAKPALYGG